MAIGLRLCTIVSSGFAFWSCEEESEEALLAPVEASSSRQTAVEEAVSKMQDLRLACRTELQFLELFSSSHIRVLRSAFLAGLSHISFTTETETQQRLVM